VPILTKTTDPGAYVVQLNSINSTGPVTKTVVVTKKGIKA